MKKTLIYISVALTLMATACFVTMVITLDPKYFLFFALFELASTVVCVPIAFDENN
jgi:hypothetical protein